MHFCLTGQYTPRAVNNLLENPTSNRADAARKLIEAAGGKLISFYSVPADGPGVLRVRITPGAARAFAQRAAKIVSAGRPPCPLCGLPLDTDGHICPRQNGHRAAHA